MENSTSRIEVRDIPGKGRGVFALVPFVAGSLIEEVPVIVLPENEAPWVEKSVLDAYVYSFGPNLECLAIALGFGSLYNHSFTPSAQYLKFWDERLIRFVALRDIGVGAEITINYNGSPSSLKPVDFEVRE